MLGFLNKGLRKILGSKSEKDLKKLQPYVNKINNEYNVLADLNLDEIIDVLDIVQLVNIILN